MKLNLSSVIIPLIVGACFSQPNDFLETRITICPERFVILGSHCYYFSQETTTVWDQAWELCRELDDRSVLVNIDSITKWHHIRNYLKEKMDKLAWWIGGTDRNKDGEWIWMGTNQPFPFTEWCPGEPNNAGGDEGCAHIQHPNGTSICWNDRSCTISTAQLHFICEA